MGERVTVIIPTYNGRQWLERCLGSLMETEYEGMTVEVIDNASGDGSADLVEEGFKRVKVLRLEVRNESMWNFWYSTSVNWADVWLER